ncbi:hypothetical protein ACFQ1M_10680 [Sungkyunkwania multivorans]|uniref:WD40 repeat protein n=1 Tax=Sungkyunkwania multivorans TaxID=1173618 RepID=A0ABW3D1F8_9FLAO
MKKIILLAFCTSSILQAQAPKITFDENFEIPKVFVDLPDFKNINIRDMAISPNYNEIFFTLDGPKYAFRTILTSKKIDGAWQPFEVASFSGSYHDIEPAFSSDGSQLFFASRRPAKGDEPKKDYDIFVTKKLADQWTEPIRLNENINSNDNEYYPSVTLDGRLYFTATRMDTKGKEDIYVSKFEDGDYQTAQSVGGKLNTHHYEYNAFVSPDGSYAIYGAYGRQGGFGKGDLYISFFKDGIWQEGINLGEMINSPQLDYCPFVTSDGKYLFFTSEKSEIRDHYDALSMDALKSVMNQPANGVSRVYYVPFQSILQTLKRE